MKIFDFHLHPGYDFHAEALSPAAFEQGLRAHGIGFCAGSVIRKADSKQPPEAYAEILPRLNREAFALSQQLPHFYTPGIHVHPDHVALSCREIEQYAAKGVRFVGELVPYLMGWSDYGDKRLIEILRVAQSKQMTLSFHPNKRPEDMLALIRALPHMPIVVAHLDGYGLYEFAIETMQRCENVYFDISAHGATRAGMLRDAVQRVGASRILFGTDYPGYSPAPFLCAVREAGLSEREQAQILCENAERLLGIRVPE